MVLNDNKTTIVIIIRCPQNYNKQINFPTKKLTKTYDEYDEYSDANDSSKHMSIRKHPQLEDNC